MASNDCPWGIVNKAIWCFQDVHIVHMCSCNMSRTTDTAFQVPSTVACQPFLPPVIIDRWPRSIGIVPTVHGIAVTLQNRVTRQIQTRPVDGTAIGHGSCCASMGRQSTFPGTTPTDRQPHSMGKGDPLLFGSNSGTHHLWVSGAGTEASDPTCQQLPLPRAWRLVNSSRCRSVWVSWRSQTLGIQSYLLRFGTTGPSKPT